VHPPRNMAMAVAREIIDQNIGRQGPGILDGVMMNISRMAGGHDREVFP